MTEQCCAICGKEVGYLGQVKLSDGNFICKDCEKKVNPYFEPAESTAKQYNGSLKQNEEGQKLYDAYFSNNKKAVALCDNCVIYDPGTALICIYGERGGIFNKTKFYNVFRAVDVEKYELTSRFKRTPDGANHQVTFISFTFNGERDGMSQFMIPTDNNSGKKIIKKLDQLLTEQSDTEAIIRADAAIVEALK